MQQMLFWMAVIRGIGICGGGIFLGLLILYFTLKYADSTKGK